MLMHLPVKTEQVMVERLCSLWVLQYSFRKRCDDISSKCEWPSGFVGKIFRVLEEKRKKNCCWSNF